jgi:hypothetical protein
MVIPLNGFVQGDTLGLVLLVRHDQTIGELAACALQAASVRVAGGGEVDVVVRGTRVDPNVTLSAAGLQPLDRVDVVFRQSPWR